MTDRRLLFAGDNKSFTINLPDVLEFRAEDGGFVISNGRSTYHLMTTDRVETTLVFLDQLQKLRQRLAA